MDKYYLREQTPLAFHKFVWYFSLPLGFLLELYYLSTTIKTMPFSHWLFAVDICYYVVSLLLRVIAFIGFFSWQGYAWKSFMAMLALNGAYNAYAVIICGIYSPQSMSSVIINLLAWGIYASLAGLYYLKRKPLFFPGEIVADATFAAAGENAVEEKISSEDASPDYLPAALSPDDHGFNNTLLADTEEEANANTGESLAPDAGYTLTDHTSSFIPPAIQYCRKCGYKLLEGSSFCSRCGCRIEDKE